MNDKLPVKSNTVGSILLPLSLFSIAAALVYFTYEISVISRQIPSILQQVDATSEKIEPVINEVNEIIVLVPSILDEVKAIRKLVPPILNEIEQTRAQIPPILKEVESIRNQIPPILAEVEKTREQIPLILDESAAIRKDLPAVLRSADKASDTVLEVAKQVEATNTLIPEVLKEVETTRESIPPLMDRADGLIEKARVAGKEASEGAVTGLFKGLITAPFVLMGDAGRKIAGVDEGDTSYFSKEDFDQVEQLSLYLLNNGKKKELKYWENTASGNHGSVELLSIYTSDDEMECRTIRIISYVGDDVFKDVQSSLCQNDDEQWAFDEMGE